MVDLSELGSTGLRRSGGTLLDEPLAALRGQRGRKIYAEMATDPVVSAFLFAVEKAVSSLDWRVDPEEDEAGSEQDAEFVDSCLHDMSDSWDGTLGEILSMLVYGWDFAEIVYKRRLGPEHRDPSKRSKYTDGRIGWRKWATRAQDTLYEWAFDEDGGLAGMVQMDPLAGAGVVTIPMEKGLLFRTTTRRSSPEGQSLLRGAYRPWYFKKRIEEIEAVGIERDLAGLPVAWVPPAYLDPNAGAAEKAILAEIVAIVQGIKRNEQDGVVWPLAYDEHGNKQFDLTLLSTGGTRQFDTDAVIARYDQRIAMSTLADWLLLGHEKVGSFALGNTKMDVWTMAVDAVAKAIANVVNAHAIPRLLRLNGRKVTHTPKLAYGDVTTVDLTAVADFVAKTIDAGALTADDPLEEHLRTISGLPPMEATRAEREEAEPDPDPAAALAALTGQQPPPPDEGADDEAA
ncbi:MAG: phage portal protein family protein [Actinomycetota bacterium]